jgi:hypothetical protein
VPVDVASSDATPKRKPVVTRASVVPLVPHDVVLDSKLGFGHKLVRVITVSYRFSTVPL